MPQPAPPRRRLKLSRVLLLAGVGLAAAAGLYLLHGAQVRRQAGAVLGRAEAAVAQKDWPAAAGLYRTYLNFRPKDTDAAFRYAAALEELTKAQPRAVFDLIKVYEALVRDDSSLTDQRRKLARHYLAVDYTTGARSHLTSLLAVPGAGDPELFDLLATCEEKELRPGPAADALRKAVATGKAGPDVYSRLATILRAQVGGRDAEAEADALMDGLVKARPNDTPVRVARARYLAAAGRRKDALADAEYAFRNLGAAADLDVVLLLAQLAVEKDELPLARDAIEKAAAADRGNTRLQVALVDLQLRSGQPDEAKKTLGEALPHAARLDEAALILADRAIDLGDYKAAGGLAERFAADPDLRSLADYLTGRARLAEGNWPAAADLLSRALAGGVKKLPPQHLTALLALAECFDLADYQDLRLKAATDALEVDKGSPAAQLARAEALAATGQTQAAADAFGKLAGRVPAARVGLARLRLAEQAGRPEADRDWSAFEAALGADPSVDLALLKAAALLVQNRQADAVALLEEVVKQAPDAPGPWVTLAMTKGGARPEDGLAVLDRADRQAAGDRAEFRLARARLLAAGPAPDPAAITALGENAAGLPPRDRYRLLAGLGGVMGGLGKGPEAVGLLKRAAAERPYDLASRAALFDLGLALGDATLQAEMLAELERVEGPDGPTRVVAEAARAIRAMTPPVDPAQLTALRDKVEGARAKRASWGRAAVVLGDLDLLGGNPDAALDQYRRAWDLGERTDGLVRNTVRLLIDRGGHYEALELLTKQSRVAALPADLLKQLAVLRAMYREDNQKTLAWARSPDAAGAKDPQVHLARAAVFAAANDPGEARKALDAALALNDTAADAWVALVRFLVATGQPEQAAAAVARAADKLKPAADTPAARAASAVALGTCYELIGELAKAEAHLKAAVAALPADPDVARQHVLFLQRTGRRPDAEADLDRLVRSPTASPAAKRWARRTLAFSKVGHPDGYADLPEALRLIDANLADGGTVLEDQRARALVLAVDPFKRDEAIGLLTESAKTVPLTADQNYLLARLYVAQNRPDRAEGVLREATRATGVAPPEYLALLVRVQLARDDVDGAAQTAAKLKAVAPKSWDAVTSEARVLAAAGKKPDAARVLLEAAADPDPQRVATRVGPLLEELGCKAEAEGVYKAAAAGPGPAAHALLGSFLARTGRAPQALRLALDRSRTAPQGTTALLLAGAARSRQLPLVPEAERAGWLKAVREAEEWVRQRLAADPRNPELLFAMAEFDDLFGPTDPRRYRAEIDRYQAAVEAAPDAEPFLNNLALLLALENKDATGKPLDLINKAMRRGPKPTYLDTRAIVHMAADRLDEAVQDLNLAIGLDPRPVLLFHRALAYDKLAAGKLGPEKARFEQARNKDLREAADKGLRKEMLHPREWAEYDRLVAARAEG